MKRITSGAKELYLPPVIPQRNPINGRFNPGITPHNKGKKWTDYMDMRHAAKIIGNLSCRKGNPSGLAGYNRRMQKKVVGVKDGKISIYEHSEDAARKLGLIGRNIRKCCNGERISHGGIRWFFFDSNDWINHIKI